MSHSHIPGFLTKNLARTNVFFKLFYMAQVFIMHWCILGEREPGVYVWVAGEGDLMTFQRLPLAALSTHISWVAPLQRGEKIASLVPWDGHRPPGGVQKWQATALLVRLLRLVSSYAAPESTDEKGAEAVVSQAEQVTAGICFLVCLCVCKRGCTCVFM